MNFVAVHFLTLSFEEEEHLDFIEDAKRQICFLADKLSILWSWRATLILLETITSRMVHVEIIISQIHHFMSRLRDLLWRSHSRRSIKLIDPTRKRLRIDALLSSKSKRWYWHEFTSFLGNQPRFTDLIPAPAAWEATAATALPGDGTSQST